MVIKIYEIKMCSTVITAKTKLSLDTLHQKENISAKCFKIARLFHEPN